MGLPASGSSSRASDGRVRLFVAINLPPAVRRGIWDAVSPLRQDDFPVKWVRPEGIHLTLKFLGEVPSERVAELESALADAAAGSRSFPLLVSGFGVFPTPRRPRVLWVGCEGTPPLEMLQHDVERAMQALGFPAEGRPFRPHLTVGRVKHGATPAALGDLPSRLEQLEYATEVPVDSVDLMASRLSRSGARYERLGAAELAS